MREKGDPAGAPSTGGIAVGLMVANAGPFTDPERARELAAEAERAGIESLWASEHVVIPVGHDSSYPYSRSGRMPGGEDISIADPLIWLAYVAAVTTKIRLATGVLILPQRNPVILAKETASLDRLSGGRLLLGMGVGWIREESEAIGIPFEERGARLDEHVAALRVLWSEREPTFHGRFTSFTRARMDPKPARATGIPIIFGGHAPAAARRAGRLGDGFFPMGPDVAHVVDAITSMRASAEAADRDPSAISVTFRMPRHPRELDRLLECGIDRLLFPVPQTTGQELIESIHAAVATVAGLR